MLRFLVSPISVQTQRKFLSELYDLFRTVFCVFAFQHIMCMRYVQPPCTPILVVVIWKHFFQPLYCPDGPHCQRPCALKPVPRCKMNRLMNVKSVICSTYPDK